MLLNKEKMYQDYIYELYKNTGAEYTCVREVTFQITNECNLRCSYCYELHKGKKVMSLEIGKKIVDLIYEMYYQNDASKLINQSTKAIILSFIGGEPLLYPDLIDEIVEYYVTKGAELNCPLCHNFRISISTNGVNYFRPDVQSFIKKYQKFLSMNVSIDGVKELHDKHRLTVDGKGSFDDAYAAFKNWSAISGHVSTKMTFVAESFKYIPDSIRFMVENGAAHVYCNYAFEPMYSYNDGTLLFNALKETADYIIDNNLSTYISMFDYSIGDKSTSVSNYCGGNGQMLSFDPDGDAYPCVRYHRTSLGDLCIKTRIGNYKGISLDTTFIKELSVMTACSQSTNECNACEVSSGCGWCSAWNYQVYGVTNKRYTGICNVHKARVLACCYYYNKRSLLLKDCLPKAINLSKEDALHFLSIDELDALYALEQEAHTTFLNNTGLYTY